MSDASGDGSRFFSGGGSSVAFVNLAQLDFWPPPDSILIGKADATFVPQLDFNERRRARNGRTCRQPWPWTPARRSLQQFAPPV